MALAVATRALRRRAADARPTQSSVDRAALRRRHTPRRDAVVRHGVRRRRSAHGVLRHTCVDDSRAAAAVPRRVRGGAARARPRNHPSRPQAVQHPRDDGRHGEAARLRDREAAREPGGRRPDAYGHASHDAGVRCARTDPRRPPRHPHRRLLVRRRALRADGRPATVRSRRPHAERDGARDPRAGGRASVNGRAPDAGAPGRHLAPRVREQGTVGRPRRAVSHAPCTRIRRAGTRRWKR